MNTRVGEILLQRGIIQKSQLEQAEISASQNGGIVNSSLVKLGFINENELTEILSKEYSLPVVDLDDVAVDKELAAHLPHNIALKYSIIPLDLNGSILHVAMMDPSNIIAINDLRFITGFDIKVSVARESEIKIVIEKLYENDVSYDQIIDDLGDSDDVEVLSTDDSIDLNALEKVTEDAPVVKLVNAILLDAIQPNLEQAQGRA
jgi:type IV pilus assembly protein PilB